MIADVAGSFKDRLNSAVFGTYTSYLLLLHWKVFVIIFSGIAPQDKIAQAEIILNSLFWWNILGAIALTSSTLYVFPKIRNWYDKWLAEEAFKLQKRLNELNRNLVRDNSEATDAIKEVVSNKVSIDRIHNSTMGAMQELKRIAPILGQGPQGQFQQFSELLEKLLNEIRDDNSKLRVSVEKLELDTRDLRRKLLA